MNGGPETAQFHFVPLAILLGFYGSGKKRGLLVMPTNREFWEMALTRKVIAYPQFCSDGVHQYFLRFK